ncbi:MAG: PEGA domain-containing protein [Pseudomonadota bacterium]
MTRRVTIRVGAGEQSFGAGDLPVSIGQGGGADVELPLVNGGAAVVWLGSADDGIFVQSDSEGVALNEAPLTGSQWLSDGDRLRIGTHNIAVEGVGADLLLAAHGETTANETLPPQLEPIEPANRPTLSAPAADAVAPQPASGAAVDAIDAVEFRPTQTATSSGGRRIRPVPAFIAGALALVAVTFWYMFTARAVFIEIQPAAESVEVSGGLFRLKFGDRYLLRPGVYRVTADLAGYRTGGDTIEVSKEENQTFTFTLSKLPGVLNVSTGDVSGATVLIDGEAVGITPLTGLDVEPGRHDIAVQADRYQAFSGTVEIFGARRQQEFDVALMPDWAAVTISSEPSGAAVLIDEVEVGTTPYLGDVGSGDRELSLRLAGFKTWRVDLDVVAGEAQDLPPVELQKLDGMVAITSRPAGAAVTVDGTYRGQTPVSLALPPGNTYRVALTRAGYQTASRQVEVTPGEDASLSVTLKANVGTVRVAASPADAQLYVNGQPRGGANQELQLASVPHRIEIRLDGYDTYSASITPRPGFPQQIRASLSKTPVVKPIKPRDPLTITTAVGSKMKLVQPGQFMMGASRREPGRRANEVLHPVSLTRPYYIGVHEVTNAEYRKFLAKHESGKVNTVDVDGELQPVVEVTWADAARYCNWLSEKDSLPLAYTENTDGTLTLKQPLTTGYRLPTEAEWVWAGRYAGSPEASRYPWGDTMPPEEGSGNFADKSASRLISKHIASYRDGFAASAPVGTFEANRLGLHDFGGNVAEWVHDIYTPNPSRGGGPSVDPTGPAEGQYNVVRGSSWRHGSTTELRFSYRDYSDVRRPDLGFRIARSLR